MAKKSNGELRNGNSMDVDMLSPKMRREKGDRRHQKDEFRSTKQVSKSKKISRQFEDDDAWKDEVESYL